MLTHQLLNCLSRRLPEENPSNSLHCFLYRLGTDHIENTASIIYDTFLLFVAQQRKALFILLAKNFSSRECVYLAVP
jgi:hypothetical protein